MRTCFSFIVGLIGCGMLAPFVIHIVHYWPATTVYHDAPLALFLFIAAPIPWAFPSLCAIWKALN
jgi:hypothetical protein